MTDANDSRPAGREARVWARIAGFLLLLSMLAGGFGEGWAPSRLVVSGDAAATAHNILASPLLFRAAFASYLVEAVCDIALSLLFYLLLKPVRHDLALLSAFFGLVATAVFAIAEFFYFGISLVLKNAAYLQSFSPDQRNTLALLLFKAYGAAGGVFLVFYGIASLIRGSLIFRSAYLPKLLGILLALAGCGFILKTFALVLAPAYDSGLLLLPMFVAGVTLTVWLLIKGIDVRRWDDLTVGSAVPAV